MYKGTGKVCISMCVFYVSVCDDTLHSCPILEIVALPVCSPSMAFSLKNRKILSSSGLSLSGIKCIPRNLGSGIYTMHQKKIQKELSCLNQGSSNKQKWLHTSLNPFWAKTSVSPVTRGTTLTQPWPLARSQKWNVTRPPPTRAAHAHSDMQCCITVQQTQQDVKLKQRNKHLPNTDSVHALWVHMCPQRCQWYSSAHVIQYTVSQRH